jgi:hypothetical protein
MSCAGFSEVPLSAGEVLLSMRHGLHDRINRHIPWHGRGRRWEDGYFMSLWRDSRRLQDLHDLRVVIHQFESNEARTRFSHLLADAASDAVPRTRPQRR